MDSFGYRNQKKNISNWELNEKIGSGSYGSIYIGCNKLTGSKNAIKKYKFDTSTDGIPPDALREIIHLKKLNHKNIIK